VLDRLQIQGSSRPLKTKFHPSPYIVVKSYNTTTLVKRLADGFMSVYSNDDIKKYSSTSPLFKDLPLQVSKVLLHDFKNLLEDDLCTITKYDSFDLPRGIELFEQDDLSYNEPMTNEGMIPLFDENPSDENPSDENPSDENPSDETPSDDNVRSDENMSDESQTRIEKIQRSLDAKEDVPPIPDTVGLNPEELDMQKAS
jgi:hypothetical protein